MLENKILQIFVKFMVHVFDFFVWKFYCINSLSIGTPKSEQVV